MNFLKNNRKRIIDYGCIIIIISIISFISYYLDAWIGYPKGDDAYLHLSKIRFILDNFPNISWNQFQYFGYEPFTTYPYIAYFIISFIYKMTGVGLETLLKAGLLFSFLLLGISIFRLSRLLGIPRLVAVAFSLLIFSTPAFWNMSIYGGAYLRMFTLPFIILSVFYSIKHIEEINSGNKNNLTLMKTIFILSLTALLHPMMWLFTFPAILLLYVIGVDEIKRTIKNLLLIFVPVSILTFWYYIPYIIIKLDVNLPHNYTPNLFLGLFRTLPNTNLTLNSTYSFFSLILILPLSVLLFKYIKKQHIIYKRSAVSLLVTSIIFSFYHLLFGWFSMPKSLYLISAYNSLDWLYLFLLFFIISSYSIFNDNFNVKVVKFETIGVALILLVIIELFFTLPLVKMNFTSHTSPDDYRTISFESKKFIDKYVASIPEDYRLGITHRVFTRWINYVYPRLKITAGRDEGSQPNKEYQDWFMDRVFYRFDHEKFGYMYIEDIPKFLPEYGFLDDKSVNPQLWFFDWTSSFGIILYPNVLLNFNTVYEYVNKPQIFDIESGKTRFGDIYYIKYNKSSPIIVASSVPTLAIPSEPLNRDNLFRKTLMILSYINADSKVIIPIKIDLNEVPLAKLNKFDRILVTDELYQIYNKELIKYVGNGGTLLITDKGKSETLESKQIVNKIEQVGNGKIVWLNVSIDEIFDTQDFVTVFNFVQLLNPLLQVENVRLSTEWNISYTTEKTLSKTLYEPSNRDIVLNYSVNPALEHNQINIFTSTMREVPTDGQGVIDLEMYSSNWKNMYTDIILTNGNYYGGFLYYSLKFKSENTTSQNKGWRKFSVPISGFKLKGDYNQVLKNFNVVEITINEDAPYNSQKRVVLLRNVTLSLFGTPDTVGIIQSEPGYVWKNPQEIIINLQNISKGILFKESFSKNWKAYLVHDNKTSKLPVYFAGPSFMYIEIPENINAPINITLEYNAKLLNLDRKKENGK